MWPWRTDGHLLLSGFCSVTKSCPTLCNPMNCNTPGFPVLDYLLEFAQIHVQWASDAIQPSHPLLLPSPLALNLSQHHGLFQWVSTVLVDLKKSNCKPVLRHVSSRGGCIRPIELLTHTHKTLYCISLILIFPNSLSLSFLHLCVQLKNNNI